MSEKLRWFNEIFIATGILSFIISGALGAFGAIVHYLFMLVADRDLVYSPTILLRFTIMGAFVGIVSQQVMEVVFGQIYPGGILVSGFLFLKILEFINASGLDLILKRGGIKK